MKWPRIAVTLADDGAGRYTLREGYPRSLLKAGGLPCALPPLPLEEVSQALESFEGLLLTGGSDIDPSLYGAPPHPKLDRVTRERDEFEIRLCQEALRRDLPILAICRGLQVLNVATGGTLIQDIPSEIGERVAHDPPVERWERAHDVTIVGGTKLEAALGRTSIPVNSSHHQAARDLGRGLRLTAVSPVDGVVEGLEAPGQRYVVAVQWHPESFHNLSPDFLGLFSSFVAEASR